MPKAIKHSWQNVLKCRITDLENENFKLNQQIAYLRAENNTLNRLVSGPPTIMIACEKVVESAAQIATTSISLIREAKHGQR